MAMAGFDRFRHLARGICPVIEVPFQASGRIDTEGFDAVVAHLLRSRVTALLWPLFASEFHKLSDAERVGLRRRLLEHVGEHPDVLCVIGVSQHATRLAIEEATAAAEEGAGAINLLPPHFLRPSRSVVLTHLRSVLAAVPDLPVIIQHAPALAVSPLDAADFCMLAADFPNLQMVKVEAQPPGPFITALSAGATPLPAMVGYGGLMMIDGIRRGAVGVQPGCSFVEIYQRIWRRWQEGDGEGAESLHRQLLPYISYWMQEVELIIQVEKTISKKRRLITDDHCRPPGRILDAEENAGIERFLKEFADYFEDGEVDSD